MISLIIGQIFLGWIISDFLSGIFHWWEDRVGNVKMPIIGKYVIVPNRLHHTEPLNQTLIGDIMANGTTWLISIIVALIWTYFFGFSLILATALLGAFLVNFVHGWAHKPKTAPKIVRMLQETGVILSPKNHSLHHRKLHDHAYCILTGWLNPILDYIKFWHKLEWMMTKIGLEPNKGTA